MNNQGRPTRPSGGETTRRGTFTGNRALDAADLGDQDGPKRR